MKLEKSCGAVVFSRRGGELRFVIVQEQTGAYSFPKGHMEGDETELETARREIREETGLRPVFLEGFRQMEEYDLGEKPGMRKRVVYFLAECGDETPVPRQGEISGILLVSYAEALTLFYHESKRRILTAAYEYLTKTQPLPSGMDRT